MLDRRLARFMREPASVRAAAGVIGRVVGAVVMLEGIAFVAIVTAAITSTFVARATREQEAARTRDDLSDRELMERRFDELERKLDRLAAAPRVRQRACKSPRPRGLSSLGTNTVRWCSIVIGCMWFPS